MLKVKYLNRIGMENHSKRELEEKLKNLKKEKKDIECKYNIQISQDEILISFMNHLNILLKG